MGKWEFKKIGDIAFTKSGGTPRRGFKTFWENGSIPWLKSGELNDNRNITESTEFVTEEAIKNSSAKLFPKGTLLLAMYGATAGKLGILGIDSATNQAVCSIQNTKELFSEEFVFYYLLLIRKDIIRDSFGGAQPNISKSYIDNIKMPLPPLPEQKRIVAKLDGLFEKIDQAIVLLEENIEHTEALMGSVLDEVYSNGNVKLEEACNVGPRKSEISDLDKDLEVSFLPMKDLNEHDINFIPKEIKKIGEVYKGYTYFAEGDVILAKVTPCFENGKAGLAKDLKNGIGFGSSEYHILRPKENVLPEWIYFAVLTEQFRVTGKENMTGAGGLKRISRDFVKDWKIPVPSLKVQKKQIERIIQIQEDTKKLESSIQEKLNNLNSLKSSLLDRAFKGEL